MTNESERRLQQWLGRLLFSAIAVGTLHALPFSSLERLQALWLAWVRHPQSPFANPWFFWGMQAVAIMWVALGRGWASGVVRRSVYCMATWTSFVGFWYFFMPENLLVPLGIGFALSIVGFLNLTAWRGGSPGRS